MHLSLQTNQIPYERFGGTPNEERSIDIVMEGRELTHHG